MTDRRTTVSNRRRAVAWLLCCSAVTCAAATGNGADLRLAGSNDAVWAYRADGTPVAPILRFAIAKPDDRGLRFRPMPPLSTGGLIRLMAARGEFLHVFYSDGSHYRLVAPPPIATSTPPPALDTAEIRLPGKTVPLAVCGSADGERLLALVPAKIGNQVHDDTWRRRQAELIARTSSPDSTEAKPKPDEQPPPEFGSASSYTLVAYQRGAWVPVTPLPADIKFIDRCWIADGPGGCTVIYSAQPLNENLFYVTLRDQAWSTVRPVPGLSAGNICAVAALGDDLAVLHRSAVSESGLHNLHTTFLRGAEWNTGQSLSTTLGDVTASADAIAADRLADQWVVTWFESAVTEQPERAPRLRVGAWSVDGGMPVQPVDEFVGLVVSVDTPAKARTHLVVVTVVLTVTLSIVFLRRRDCFLSDFPAPAGYELAGLGHRALAFILDLVIVAPVVVGIVILPWLVANDVRWNSALSQDLQYLQARDPYAVYWRWIACFAIFVVYAIAMEARVGATLGKLTVGLRVCDSTGKRAAFRDIVIRNVLRFEIYYNLDFFPVAILAALTRNRQRLGDLVARTIVVQRKTQTTPTPPPSPPSDA